MRPIRDYRRMGGWLLFFAIDSGYMVLQCLLALVTNFAQGDWLAGALMTLRFCLHTAVFTLLLLHRGTLRPLYLSAVGLYVVSIAASLFTETDTDTRNTVLLLGLLSLLELAAWAVYLYRSRRVAVWVGEDPFPEGAQLDAMRANPAAFYGAGYPQQGYPQQGNPQQGYPQQGYPQQPNAPAASQPLPAQVRYCPHCGAALRDGANFCGGCGRPLQ